ncbi:MAG: hypothetical protein JNL11_05470 [Bdellovibrionaceae bacterium]|nr:hypothetical protein [Pseudobdellovibrionaceae bacterium]
MWIFVLTMLTLSITTFAEVWTVTKSWDTDAEKQYSIWVQKNWSIDFFSRKENQDGTPNIFQGLRVDCADTVYSTRVIFAYLHSLPFVMNDASGGKNLISNSMTRWDSLPEKDRVRKFLVFIYNIVSTKSLPYDTYPVKVSPSTIVPGALILTVGKNHHSWVIRNIFSTGIPHLIFNSTVNAYSSLILQERKSWPNGDWVFEDDITPKGHAGIRYWRKESELKLPVWQVTGYSEDQYTMKAGKWKYELQKILQTAEESNQQKVTRLIENICADIRQRAEAVRESEAFLKSNNYACLSEADFDSFSTPSRDKRLADEIIYLRNFLKMLVSEKTEISLDAKTWQQLNNVFPNLDVSIDEESRHQKIISVSANSFCKTKYFSRSQNTEHTTDFAEIKRRLFLHRLSSNPNHPPEVRFGDGMGKVTDSCPTWGNLKLNYAE